MLIGNHLSPLISNFFICKDILISIILYRNIQKKLFVFDSSAPASAGCHHSTTAATYSKAFLFPDLEFSQHFQLMEVLAWLSLLLSCQSPTCHTDLSDQGVSRGSSSAALILSGLLPISLLFLQCCNNVESLLTLLAYSQQAKNHNDSIKLEAKDQSNLIKD